LDKLLLAFASTVILSSGPHVTHDHMFQFQVLGKLLRAYTSTVILDSQPHGIQDHIFLFLMTFGLSGWVR
jgi:hypothetical protein